MEEKRTRGRGGQVILTAHSAASPYRSAMTVLTALRLPIWRPVRGTVLASSMATTAYEPIHNGVYQGTVRMIKSQRLTVKAAAGAERSAGDRPPERQSASL